MEKKVFCNSTIEIESQKEMNEHTAQLGWLTRGAASDFHFAQRVIEQSPRRTHTLHRSEGVHISRREDGLWRITLTLGCHTAPAHLREELYSKTAQASRFIDRS